MFKFHSISETFPIDKTDEKNNMLIESSVMYLVLMLSKPGGLVSVTQREANTAV